jgi:hypothetical protein
MEERRTAPESLPKEGALIDDEEVTAEPIPAKGNEDEETVEAAEEEEDEDDDAIAVDEERLPSGAMPNTAALISSGVRASFPPAPPLLSNCLN